MSAAESSAAESLQIVRTAGPSLAGAKAQPFLQVRGLSKSFRRQNKFVTALENFDLTVETGEFVAIVGPSGCGQSTFLHMLAGSEPIDGGSMNLDGIEVSKPGPDRGMLFQEYALYPWRTVESNILWPLEIQKVPKAERRKIADRF